ncbi:MAG: hypothetical protein M1816_004970 [Peltula sp. TS41687]|nr:MAG: hypothetical protein M1816_004970 [Peltula sp. TS41687]
MEKVDVVVIGAGWHGLAAARTYVEIKPTVKLVVLEAAKTVGGVWAAEHLYSNLRSNNLLGTYEYSDFPMDEATFGVKPGEYIPGRVIHDYLHRYAKKFDVYRRIRFEAKVDSVERQAAGGWLINIVPAADKSDRRRSENNINENTRLLTQKLVVATGLTSEPTLPGFSGSESFEAPLFHCKVFPQRADELLKSAKSVVVLGGTKSGWDMVYSCASAGVQVDWVIRKSGHGPMWLVPSHITPFQMWIEAIVTTRCMTWFSPCSWGGVDGFGYIRRLLHGTQVGRWLVAGFWALLTRSFLASIGFEKHPETRKLRPWINPFWHGTTVGILNYPTDFFDLVRTGAVRVHIDDLSHLSSKTVHLASGASLRADALICATGWSNRPPLTFLPEADEAWLGLPGSSSQAPVEEGVLRTAEDEILDRFPGLGSRPDVFGPTQKPFPGNEDPTTLKQPYRLYRFMVPPAFLEDRSIAFTGMMQSYITALNAQTQALWLAAYLEGKLSLDRLRALDKELDDYPKPAGTGTVEWDTVLHSQFGKLRYPAGKGLQQPDFILDAVPYLDWLLRDLGLEHRRKGGLLAECFAHYGPRDYRGLVDEWRIKGK